MNGRSDLVHSPPHNPLPFLPSHHAMCVPLFGGFRCALPTRNRRKMESQTRIIVRSASPSPSPCPPSSTERDARREATISLREWQGWGTFSHIPAMVLDVIEDLKLLERDMDSQMSFGGLGGKLQVRLINYYSTLSFFLSHLLVFFRSCSRFLFFYFLNLLFHVGSFIK